MSLSEYLYHSWNLLVLLGGILIILKIDIYVDKKMIRRMMRTTFLLLVYSITYYIENSLHRGETLSQWRVWLTAFNYSLITMILVSVITIMFPMQRLWLLFPCILNAALCFVSIPTHIVFWFTEDNSFQRSTLGYLPYFIDLLYIIYLTCCMFGSSAREREDFVLIFFMVLTAALCLVVPLITTSDDEFWLTGTVAADVLIYYIFLLHQYTKRDPLTRLLNRQSYFADADKFADRITAVLSIDMNGLKELNDNEGHVAGDTALKSLAECFLRAAANKHRIYRMGGDEYAILCIGAKPEDVTALTARITEEVEKVPYTCSVGYALKTADETVSSMYHTADEMMYENKRRYYEASGRDRRRR